MAVSLKEMVLVQSGVTDFRGAFFDSANSQWTATKPLALSAGTQSINIQTISFANSNGVSWGMSGSTQITASIVAGGGGLAAGSQTATSGTVVFSNSNGLTWGMSGSSQITASMDALRSVVAGGSTATGSRLDFIDSNGVFWGASTAVGGASITAAWPKVSYWENGKPAPDNDPNLVESVGVQRISIPFQMTATRLDFIMGLNAALAQSGWTISAAFYTMSASTASIVSSASTTFSLTHTSVSNAYRSVTLNSWNITPGEYLLGMSLQSVTAGAQQFFIYGLSKSIVGAPGGGNYAQYFNLGNFSIFRTDSMVLSEITQTGGLFVPFFALIGTQ